MQLAVPFPPKLFTSYLQLLVKYSMASASSTKHTFSGVNLVFIIEETEDLGNPLIYFRE